MAVRLFDNGLEIGTFKGFAESGLEFAAEIIAPYHPDEALTPRSGQLLLVELGTPDEAILGRITRFVPVGVMAGPEGDEYIASMARLDREIPQQLKEDRLRYNVRVKLLGGIRSSGINDAGVPRFVPSVRKLPHLGARVAYPTTEILAFLCRLGAQDASRDTEIGCYALGEVVYNGGEAAGEDFFVTLNDRIPVHFDVSSLVGKRTFVFARAGYGKSNLMKLLVAELYRRQPTVQFRDQERPVGTLIFDPEGEYFWPDESGRPGLCDVPHLRDRIAVFTNRASPNPYYNSWKAGDIRLDLRQCQPSEVVGLCISGDRQEHQNVIKIRTISSANWPAVVDLLHDRGYDATDAEMQSATGIATLQSVECNGMRSNLVPIIRTLHDPDSTFLRAVRALLREGRIVVVDISLVSGRIGLQIAGLLLNDVFANNQVSFTDPDKGGVLPVIAVLEEAQSVLGRSAGEDSPFVQWTKEGRKYSLGSILVTQQPGSIMPELLSQGDNFFAFHLLSAHDLKTLQFHNAHFSDDVLAHLLNEPIRGNAYFWAAPHQPFVLPVRVRSFEQEYQNAKSGTGELGQAVDTSLEELMTAEQGMISRLAVKTKDIITGGEVEVFDATGDETLGAVYKPRLSALVAKQMTTDERQEYCGGPEKQFVTDVLLDQIVSATGLCGPSLRKVKGTRETDGKDGDFYLFPRSLLGAQIKRGGSVNLK